MIRAGFVALLSHWRRQPLQIATLVVGLALATALWSGVQAINAEARASYDAAERALGADLPVLVARDGGSIDASTYIALRRAGWMVSPVVEGDLATGAGRVRLLGVEPLTAPAGTVALPEGAAAPAEFLAGEGRLFAAPATAARLAGAAGLPPVIEAPDLAPGIALTDIGVAQRLLERADRIDRLLVGPEAPLGRPALDAVAPGLERRPPGAGAEVGRLTDSFHLNLTAFGLLSFAVGLFIVNGAVGLAVEQRRPVFRTLRALGMPLRTLLGLLAAELLVFAVLAGALGMALGGLIAAALLPDVAATLRGLYGAPVEGGLSLRPAWWAAGLAIAVAGTAVASAGALWKVARLPVLAPAQPRAWARASERRLAGQGAAALALLALAAALGWRGDGLVAGFAMLGALLLAAALALPLWLSAALALGARLSRGPVAQWFWADTRQQLPGLSLALMALLLALAANIGVGTMVQSFRTTFTGWLDQRLAAELYVDAADPAQAGAIAEWLAPRADAVLPTAEVEADLAGAPGTLVGMTDHATYRESWPLLSAAPDAWDRLGDGTGVLVNEQLSRRAGLAPGDTLALPDGWSAEVVGVYSDYGNPRGEARAGLDALRERVPRAEVTDLGVRVAPEAAEALRADLAAAFDLGPQAVVDQGAIKAASLRIFERTFAVTGALNVLTLGVAAVAILTALLTLAGMRLPQLAPVWAMGLTRAQLGRLELARALALAALTAVAALPVGLALAWVLLAVINVQAFGWRLPMALFPGDWLRLGALALLAAGLAGLWPARRLATRPAADLVKVFAHER